MPDRTMTADAVMVMSMMSPWTRSGRVETAKAGDGVVGRLEWNFDEQQAETEQADAYCTADHDNVTGKMLSGPGVALGLLAGHRFESFSSNGWITERPAS